MHHLPYMIASKQAYLGPPDITVVTPGRTNCTPLSASIQFKELYRSVFYFPYVQTWYKTRLCVLAPGGSSLCQYTMLLMPEPRATGVQAQPS